MALRALVASRSARLCRTSTGMNASICWSFAWRGLMPRPARNDRTASASVVCIVTATEESLWSGACAAASSAVVPGVLRWSSRSLMAVSSFGWWCWGFGGISKPCTVAAGVGCAPAGSVSGVSSGSGVDCAAWGAVVGDSEGDDGCAGAAVLTVVVCGWVAAGGVSGESEQAAAKIRAHRAIAAMRSAAYGSDIAERGFMGSLSGL